MIASGNAIAVRSANRRGVARRGTMFEDVRKPMELIVIVVTLLSYGCPVQAIVHAFDLDERTVAVGVIAQGRIESRVHHALIETGKLDLVQGPR
jgi:hypothetical protein